MIQIDQVPAPQYQWNLKLIAIFLVFVISLVAVGVYLIAFIPESKTTVVSTKTPTNDSFCKLYPKYRDIDGSCLADKCKVGEKLEKFIRKNKGTFLGSTAFYLAYDLDGNGTSDYLEYYEYGKEKGLTKIVYKFEVQRTHGFGFNADEKGVIWSCTLDVWDKTQNKWLLGLTPEKWPNYL